MATRTIKADYLARVEGEGAMHVVIRDGRVEDVQLKIFEPPRFFEAFLRGRDFREAPDITSRICGICPIAYQMSAINAMEDVCGVRVGGALRDLRRLIYCGEWIESHVLHIYMLHAPDFLGYAGAVEMARDDAAIVERGLKMKKAGNEILKTIGGREIHPINMKVGGFHRVPTRRELEPLAEQLKWGRDAARETVRWVAEFDFPEFEKDYTFITLRHPDEYAIHEGRIVSNRGLDIALGDFDAHFEEEHVAHSNALHCVMKNGGGAYMTGPMARHALNGALLSPLAREAAREAGLPDVCRNPFRSIVVRAVEVLYAFDEALRIIAAYEPPDAPAVDVAPRAGTGFGCTEAPRGICWHTYTLDEGGIIRDARIVPPTSQNQKTIEDDLVRHVGANLDLDDDKLTRRCEQAIRNYDPCISCATHFLKARIERR